MFMFRDYDVFCFYFLSSNRAKVLHILLLALVRVIEMLSLVVFLSLFWFFTFSGCLF
jgi:hypothetical protein